jgi:AraC-like DNA-binding protein
MVLSLAPGVFFGRRLAERRTPHLSLVLTSYARGTVLPLHAHERPYLLVVLMGAFRERLGAREQRAGEGALLLNAVGAEHRDAFEAERTDVLNVELDRSWIEGLPVGAARAPAFAEGRPFLARIRALRTHLARSEPLAGVVLEGLCAELLEHAVRPARRGGVVEAAWLTPIEEALRARFRDPPALGELAALAGCSPSHLARAFRARHGLSIGAWLRRARVEHARAAVLRSCAGLGTIALAAGYADQSHMTREFRRLLGCTPGALRARA